MSEIQAATPLPIQIVIDDVGWWSGRDGSQYGEPYRTGIARDHVPADYEAIAMLGRRLQMRPQAAMILCEWDTSNILRRLPTCTWTGVCWNNECWNGPWLQEAATILRDNKEFIELTLHGIGHEYWQHDTNGNKSFTRAEWHDTNGIMRPKAEVLARLELFQELLDRHELGDFPSSFVPCAFHHCFGDNEANLAELLKERGVRFISTPFATMRNARLTEHEKVGFDHEVLTVDRGKDLMAWHAIGEQPAGELPGPICGMHWPNILHPDPQRNDEIVESWVEYLQNYNNRVERLLARDTASFASQLLYHYGTKCELQQNGMSLNFSEYSRLPALHQGRQLVVKIAAKKPLCFSSNEIEIESVDYTQLSNKILHTLFLTRLDDCVTARIAFQ